jgi:hydroxymethylglutaryl-CoA lyase
VISLLRGSGIAVEEEMVDLPRRVSIQEDGPREGFQIEPQPVPTVEKVRFIEALAGTGLSQIECVSFVNPKRVPGMADAEVVTASIHRRPGVRYTGLWLNLRGLERAAATDLDLAGTLHNSASETFLERNSGKTLAENLAEQKRLLGFYRAHSISVESATISTAFGCNFEGDIAPSTVCERVAMLIDAAAEFDAEIGEVVLADTVGWANPNSIAAVVGRLRDRWPDRAFALHLHDTRGTGLANALMGLQMGIASFDASCGGLGGCPFASHKGAAGNICTEDLVFMCEEMGIETGVDLDALIECAQLAESIVGHPLPGKVMRAGGLRGWHRVE